MKVNSDEGCKLNPEEHFLEQWKTNIQISINADEDSKLR